MKDLLKWYFFKVGFNNINTRCQYIKEFTDLETYNVLSDKYFALMPYSNITSKNRVITLGESGSYFIQKIWDKYIDDDTLVISTTCEHETVTKLLNKTKNTYLLKGFEFHSSDMQSIVTEAKKYKKVFVYIIGTQISTGVITPQSFFINLKKAFDENNIDYKLMLDDVHGMFFALRDYTLFDYILYTAHAIIPQYEMGLLISKNGEFGEKIYNWLDVYYNKLLYIRDKYLYYSQFKNILTDYFSDCINSYCQIFAHTVNHIFSLRLIDIDISTKDKEKLKEYGIETCDQKVQIGFLRIRIQEFLQQTPEKAFEGLEFAKEVLKKAFTIKELKGEL